jgi:outer membrane protein, heavy metal efflux system
MDRLRVRFRLSRMKPSALALAAIAFSMVAHAQVRLTLADAVQQALSGNPQMDAAQGRIEQTRAERVQAGLAPNPRFVAQTEDVRFWGDQNHNFADTTEDFLYFGQLIESGGKRGRRVDLASSTVRSSELQRDLLVRQLRGRVSAAYWNAAGSAKMRDLLRENLQTYEEDVNYIKNRVGEGVMAEADLMRVEVERDRVRAQSLAAARDADAAIVELYRSMGRADFPPTDLVDALDSRKAVILPEIGAVLNSRPEAQAARERVTEAEANVSLQRANAKPDPEVFAGYKRVSGLDTLYGAVQIDIPVRNRNQGNIASSVAQVRIARANLAYTEANIRAELEAAERAYRDEQGLVELLPATLDRARESERLARAAYREGAIDLIRLLDAERNRIDVQAQYYRALVDLQQSIVNLSLAAGEMK